MSALGPCPHNVDYSHLSASEPSERVESGAYKRIPSHVARDGVFDGGGGLFKYEDRDAPV